jgi:hypothetical protein
MAMKSFEEMLALTSDVESVFGAEEHGGLIEGTENLPTVHELMSTAVRVADIVELRDVAQKLECGGVRVIRMPGNLGNCRGIPASYFGQLSRNECIHLACLSSSSPALGGPTLAEQFLICYVELFINANSALSTAAAYMVLARELGIANRLHQDMRKLTIERFKAANAPLETLHQLEALAWSAARLCPAIAVLSQFASELDDWLESATERGLRGAQLLRAFDAEQAMPTWRRLKGPPNA